MITGVAVVYGPTAPMVGGDSWQGAEGAMRSRCTTGTLLYLMSHTLSCSYIIYA